MRLCKAIELALAGQMSYMGLTVTEFSVLAGMSKQAASKRLKAAAKSVDALEDVSAVLKTTPLKIIEAAEKRREMEECENDARNNRKPEIAD